MERNQKLLYAFFVTLVAALVGCGGGSDPSSNAVTPSGGSGGSSGTGGSASYDAGNDIDTPDGDCPMKLGGACLEEGKTDPCTGWVCTCGKWQDPSSSFNNAPCVDPDAGEAGGEDVVQPDVDAGPPDVVTPVEICGNGLDDDGNGKADCQDSACINEIECQEESCNGQDDNSDGIKDNGPGMECVQNTTTASCQTSCLTFGIKTCGNDCKWPTTCTPPSENCTNTIDDNCDGKADCEDPSCSNDAMCQCDPPTIDDWCSAVGEFSCDPAIRCDCAFKWNYTATADYSCINTEECNGQDDNGSGHADDGPGMTCVMGSSEQCPAQCGSIGTKPCNSTTCTWDACQAPVENCFNSIDDDCDGDADCADIDCQSLLACQDEVCDGVDNNGNGQTDEGFECIAGSLGGCTNSCGFSGTRDCSSSCTWDACIVFENCYFGGDEDCDGNANCADSDCSALPMCQPENCTNGVDDNANNLVDCDDPECQNAPNCQPEICDNNVDDDGDNLVDCDDPECQSVVACHDFGTCAVQGAPGIDYECGTWTLDDTPFGIAQIQAGCANSEFDQWAMGDDYGSARVLHLTNNHTWNEVALPVPGHGGSAMDVICLDQDQVFMSYKNENGGVVLHWNGSSFVRLMANELDDLVVMALWGTGVDNLWLFGFDNSPIEALPGYMYHWNGSSLTRHDLPDFGNKVFRGFDLFGEQADLYLAGFESDPDDYDNPATHKSALLHWDGKSWAKVPGSDSIKEFYAVQGSSSCDIMAVGGKHTVNGFVGATFQRNGNQWVTETHDSVSAIGSVVKVSPHKFVLQGSREQGVGLVVMGTPSSTGTINWSSIDDQFYNPGASWKIPNTSPQIYISAGYASSGAQIWRTSCQ